jgi:hypothetical protein
MPQNRSGRSIAYTRYTNAAMLKINDSNVMCYTQSQNSMNTYMATNVASPSSTIPAASTTVGSFPGSVSISG